MAYRDLLTELAGTTEDKAAQIYATFEAGDITADECEALIAAVIGKANVKATSLAVTSLAATLMLQLGEAVPVTAAPLVESEHLKMAVHTIIRTPDDKADPIMRIRRLGHSEPIATAARAYSDGIAESKVVTGWTRSMSPGACELCQHWHDDGKVFPSKARMAHHTGCTCTQKPVTKERATNAAASRANRNNRSAAARASLSTR